MVDTKQQPIRIEVVAGETLVLNVTANEQLPVPPTVPPDFDDSNVGSVKLMLYDENEQPLEITEAYLVSEAKNGFYTVPVNEGIGTLKRVAPGEFEIALTKPEGMEELKPIEKELPIPDPPDDVPDSLLAGLGTQYITKAIESWISDIYVNQLKPNSTMTGMIDQDSGNCTFTSKIMMLLAHGYIKYSKSISDAEMNDDAKRKLFYNAKLDDFLNVFYAEPIIKIKHNTTDLRFVKGKEADISSDKIGWYSLGEESFGDFREVYELNSPQLPPYIKAPSRIATKPNTFYFKPVFRGGMDYPLIRSKSSNGFNKTLEAIAKINSKLLYITQEGKSALGSLEIKSIAKKDVATDQAYMIVVPNGHVGVIIPEKMTQNSLYQWIFDGWILDPNNNQNDPKPYKITSFNLKNKSIIQLSLKAK